VDTDHVKVVILYKIGKNKIGNRGKIGKIINKISVDIITAPEPRHHIKNADKMRY